MSNKRPGGYDPVCVAVWVGGPLLALAAAAAILKAVLR